MTNSPAFPWHLTNLRNYTGMRPDFQKDLPLGQTTIKSLGKSSGLIGLPGDFTAPARFIKASILLNNAAPVDQAHAFNHGFHILAMSDIPKGVVQSGAASEYTQYTVLYDQIARSLAIKLYDNQDIQELHFDEKLASAATPKLYELNKIAHYQQLN